MRFATHRILFAFILFSGAWVNGVAGELISNQNLESSQVTPIAWSHFKCQPASGADAERFGKILLNANKYGLTTWWQAHGFDHPLPAGWLNFKGKNEANIRPAACEAEALATSLRLGLYRSDATGVSPSDAERKTLQLIRSLAHSHLANATNGWGSTWQSPYWAACASMAAWLMWDRLDAPSQKEVVRMLESEAEWVMTNKHHPKIKTYRDRSGTIISPGDTGLEENAWDSYVLQAATAMMPGHPQQSRWMNQVITLMLTAHARPSDLLRSDVFHGQPLSEWLPGSNANEDGTAINHNILHPDYMVAGLFQDSPVGFYSLAHRPVPQAGIFNLEVLYEALADLKFTPAEIIVGKPVQPPGGTIYQSNSADIYYPQGNDWGTGRRLHFAYADALIAAFSRDPGLRQKAEAWEQQHAEKVLAMQARFSDGHTYGAKTEDTYAGREEWIADFAAKAYLLEWLAGQNAVAFTNQKY